MLTLIPPAEAGGKDVGYYADARSQNPASCIRFPSVRQALLVRGLPRRDSGGCPAALQTAAFLSLLSFSVVIVSTSWWGMPRLSLRGEQEKSNNHGFRLLHPWLMAGTPLGWEKGHVIGAVRPADARRGS